MKRMEWGILVLLIVGVAALEVFDTGDGSLQTPRPGATPREAAQTTEPAGSSVPTADPMAAYRTVRLHVTGMT